MENRFARSHEGARHRRRGETTPSASSSFAGADETSDVIVTALHCVDGRTSVGVRFASGAEATARVAATDATADQAVLVLPKPAPDSATPLRIATRRQIPGTVL